MPNADHESWLRVKERLRAEVGEDIYSSWFARMDLEAIEDGAVHLSVPTRFLKSWIQSHYTERVLACWQAENAKIVRDRGDRALGGASRDGRKPKAEAAPSRRPLATQYRHGDRPMRAGDAPARTGHDALGGSPLDRAAHLRELRGRPLQYAGARRRQAGRGRASAAIR